MLYHRDRPVGLGGKPAVVRGLAGKYNQKRQWHVCHQGMQWPSKFADGLADGLLLQWPYVLDCAVAGNPAVI